jgi:uncharacterized protein (UPF0332 family)
MDNFSWCIKKKAFEIVEPNENLSKAYLLKAKDALATASAAISREWRISAAYYSMYFSLYSILMRMGVKCENHSCALAFAGYFLKNYFSEEEIGFLNDPLKARVNAQYYVNRKISDKQYEKMLKRAPQIVVKCKSIVQQLTEEDVSVMRSKIIGALKI